MIDYILGASTSNASCDQPSPGSETKEEYLFRKQRTTQEAGGFDGLTEILGAGVVAGGTIYTTHQATRLLRRSTTPPASASTPPTSATSTAAVGADGKPDLDKKTWKWLKSTLNNRMHGSPTIVGAIAKGVAGVVVALVGYEVATNDEYPFQGPIEEKCEWVKRKQHSNLKPISAPSNTAKLALAPPRLDVGVG